MRSQHQCVVIDVQVLVLARVVAMVPVEGAVDMLHMLLPCIGCLGWYLTSKQCLALYWHLVIPWCPSRIACRILSLSARWMTGASPFKMSPSLIVISSQWLWYGLSALGRSLKSSDHPATIVSGSEHILDCLLKFQFLLWCDVYMMNCCQMVLQGQLVRHSGTKHQEGASPIQACTWLWDHSFAVWEASFVDELET